MSETQNAPPYQRCPFCGSDDTEFNYICGTSVQCFACGAEGPTCDDEDAAEAAWNRRESWNCLATRPSDPVPTEPRLPDDLPGVIEGVAVEEMEAWKHARFEHALFYAQRIANRVMDTMAQPLDAPDNSGAAVADDTRRLAELVELCKEAMSAGYGHGHWDSTMQHGAGCPLCISRRETNDRIEQRLNALATTEGAGTE